MVSKKMQKGIGKAIAPIMAIYALGASQGGVNAGMATMGAAFPDAGANIAYVVSMVALGMIPAGLISGVVTGRYIKYKTSILVAVALYVVAGLAPAFFPDGTSFAVLLATRFVFGLAVGWSYPLAQAMVFKMFDDEQERASWLGVGMAFFNIGQIIMEFGGGYLAAISWKACFFVYLIGIPPLVLVALLFEEPETDMQQAAEHAAETGSEVKKSIPPITFAYMAMMTLSVVFAMPTILYCSFVVGDPKLSGWVLSGMVVVGAISGFTLGPVYKKLGKWTLPVAVIYLGVFFIICGVTSQPESFNLAGYIAAFLIGHWGFAILIPATANVVTNLVPIASATRAMGINTAFHQAGCFLATPVAALLLSLIGGVNVTDVMLPSAILLTICGVILLALTAATKMEKYGDNYSKNN